MDSPLPSSPICDQPDTFSPVEDFEEKMLEAGDAVLCPHTLRVVRSQSFTGKATDGAQRVVRSRSFTAKILCEEASDGAEDLDNVIWTGDDAEVNISPYHPLHKGAPLPADEEERNEVLLAEVCAHLGVMDTGKEGELDAWAAITLKVFQAEHAWVDSDRVWTKAEKGCGNLDLPRELDRAISFDAHTILSENNPERLSG
ncbi:hypothetical protein T484DRAFT_1764130 [Baffinella frigidus]|nr:hypothetical protein T484DRAFT_1764130 [Cryptophyta sp. CCMP2293]